MNLELLWTLLTTSIVVITGWFIAHRLSSNREREAKRREMRVQYLLDVWRRLEDVSARTDPSQNCTLESAIGDIQLFGSNKQIDLALKFAQDFSKNGHADLEELLNDLRCDLRKELRLETSSKKIKHLRIGRDSGNVRKK